MAFDIEWLGGREAVAETLREAHRRRHAEGRLEGRRLREKQGIARDERTSRRARDEWNRGGAAMRRRRLRQQAEEEADRRRLGAALRKANRQMEKDARDVSCHAAFEQRLIDRAPTGDSHVRDLFVEWFSRGFDSGRQRTDAGRRKLNSTRTAAWSPGEFASMIGYIHRDGAKEDVGGSFLSNMGEDIEEAAGCARAIEEAEGMGRRNGGVYKHVIVALPHQLTPPERLALLHELVAPLREMGLPFCAAPHRPDPKGDPRNFHAHILHSLRPMTREGPNRWSFSENKLTWFDCPEGIRLQRRLIAKAFNRALERSGHEERWTARSREARGLSSPGNTKKGPERIRAERAAKAAEAAAEEARAELRELEKIATGAKALMSLSDRLDDTFSRRMRERAERDLEEPPTWEEELERMMRLDDERARREGRPIPTDILSGIEEPDEEPAPSAPAPAIAADPAPVCPSEGVCALETIRLRSEAKEREKRQKLESARVEAEAKEREKQERREQLTARDLEVVHIIDGLQIPMNDPDAFFRVRCTLTGNPTVYFRRTPENIVIGGFEASFAEDVCRIAECEAGRRYLAAMAPALEPWPKLEPPGVHQVLVPAKPYRAASATERKRRGRTRESGR